MYWTYRSGKNPLSPYTEGELSFLRGSHNLAYSPDGLYQFDSPSSSGEDTSGNGRDISNPPSAHLWNYGGAHLRFALASGSDAAWSNQTALSMYAMVLIEFSTGSYENLWYLLGSGSHFFGGLQIRNDGLRYIHRDGGAVDRSLVSSAIIPSRMWVHAGFTRDAAGTLVKIYLNGIKVDEATLSDPPGSSGTSSLSVGDSNLVICVQTLKVVPTELTESEMLGEANLCLGL